MQELVHQIAQNTGISQQQAELALKEVARFVKEKYPLLQGNVDSVLGITSLQTSTNFISQN